jgi:hypothetical protein
VITGDQDQIETLRAITGDYNSVETNPRVNTIGKYSVLSLGVT